MLAGLFNSSVLVLTSVMVLYEAVERMISPPDVGHDHLLVTAVAGLAINFVGLYIFGMEGHAKICTSGNTMLVTLIPTHSP